jgi:hypothetical protein
VLSHEAFFRLNGTTEVFVLTENLQVSCIGVSLQPAESEAGGFLRFVIWQKANPDVDQAFFRGP